MLGDGMAGFYVADVSGHGAASAFVTAILTTLVGKYRQALSLSGDETVLHPGRLLDRLDRDLSALPLDKHVTMFYGVLDLERGRLRYANAGLFPFPLVRVGSSARVLECPGRPLALPGPDGGRTTSAGELAFPADARMLVGTDGLLEIGTEGSQREKWEHVRQAFEKSDDVETLIAHLGLDGKAALRDDVAVLYLGGTEVSHG